MALIVGTWLWGNKYGPEYVAKLEAGVRRHLKQPFEWRVFAPEAPYRYLTDILGCFIRLRMFDPEWQRANGINEGDRLVCLDLDAVVTGSLDQPFDRQEPFVILTGANTANPCPYNGSVMMLRAGAHPEIWNEFSIEASLKIKAHEFPDDQGWLWHKIPDAAGWPCGAESGIYAFQKNGWPAGVGLPAGARLVVFPGWRDPAMFAHLDWVKEYWRA